MAKKFPTKGTDVSSLGNVNQKDTPWGGGKDVERPYNDPKSSSKNSGVDSSVFNKDGSNTIPLVADAAKKGNNKNHTGKLFPEAGTSCNFDAGGVARPIDAGK